MEKHAYMIMAHNNFEILIEILNALDHERNDVFLHIDQKTPDVPQAKLLGAMTKGKVYIIPRMRVSWGGYSQIECELRLMEFALKTGHYAYYHMSTGATYPLKTPEQILNFFDSHQGYQFIGFDNQSDYSGRAQRYNVFNEIGKASTKSDQCKAFVRNKFRGLQRRLGYVYKPVRGIEFKKGFVYWSLTEDAVMYAVARRSWIEQVFKHSFCGDELFMQTILYHSPYRDQVYDYDSEYDSCLRYVKPVRSWDPDFSGSNAAQFQAEELSITVDDVEKCLKSGMLFGFKFTGSAGLKAIRAIKEMRKVSEEIENRNSDIPGIS